MSVFCIIIIHDAVNNNNHYLTQTIYFKTQRPLRAFFYFNLTNINQRASSHCMIQRDTTKHPRAQEYLIKHDKLDIYEDSIHVIKRPMVQKGPLSVTPLFPFESQHSLTALFGRFCYF